MLAKRKNIIAILVMLAFFAAFLTVAAHSAVCRSPKGIPRQIDVKIYKTDVQKDPEQIKLEKIYQKKSTTPVGGSQVSTPSPTPGAAAVANSPTPFPTPMTQTQTPAVPSKKGPNYVLLGIFAIIGLAILVYVILALKKKFEAERKLNI